MLDLCFRGKHHLHLHMRAAIKPAPDSYSSSPTGDFHFWSTHLQPHVPIHSLTCTHTHAFSSSLSFFIHMYDTCKQQAWQPTSPSAFTLIMEGIRLSGRSDSVAPLQTRCHQHFTQFNKITKSTSMQTEQQRAQDFNGCAFWHSGEHEVRGDASL